MGHEVFAIAVALAVSTLALAAEPEMPAWMGGCWIQKGERWTEECWMAPRGESMLGASRTGYGDRVTETENMRIDIDREGEGGFVRMTFRAIQQTGSWTVFEHSQTATGITFVNPTHDYPQRIRYWREGEALLAEISMMDGSNPRRWKYARSAN